MSISKKMRFEVFKRDGFKCAYCGQTPPAVVLEVDHIDPVSKGGKDVMANLITACFDCNRGKSNGSLTSVPVSLAENAESIKEREEQIKQYRKLVKSVEARKNKDVEAINDIYRKHFPGWRLSEKFRQTSLKMFVDRIPLDVLESAMHKACVTMADDSGRATKYFCGICWNIIRGAKK